MNKTCETCRYWRKDEKQFYKDRLKCVRQLVWSKPNYSCRWYEEKKK